MRAYKLVLAGAAGAAILSGLTRSRDGSVSMHRLDWQTGEEEAAPRRYRSLSHLLHHFAELAVLATPVFEVYVFRALEPAFREQVMVVTAAANECPA